MPDEPKRHHQQYVIDKICPKRQIHLIGGPSGAGKTTWLFQIAEEWFAGKDILGYKSNPEPFLYLAADRDGEETLRTLDRVRVASTFPIIGLQDRVEWARECERERQPQYRIALRNAYRDHPECRVYFIDGFTYLCPGDQNKKNDVAQFILWVKLFCTQRDITIFGLVDAVKEREDSRILNPRQKVAGSAAWGHLSNCIFFIEPITPETPEDKRRYLWVCPRNAPDVRYEMNFADGRLVQLGDSGTQEQSWYEKTSECLNTFDSWVITRDHFKEALPSIPESTLTRMFKRLAADGKIESSGVRGSYRRVNPS